MCRRSRALLLDSHNEMVAYYEEATGQHPKDGDSIDPCTADRRHLVIFDEKELQLLIAANCEYSLEGSAPAKLNFHEEAFERHVRER